MSPAHLEARRGEILAGARRAFAQYGYEGATVARLEEETGLSRGAIFHYFPDKKALFVALAAEVNERYVELMRSHGLDEALRAIAAESREWLAVMIETEVRLHHDEDFVHRLEAATEHLREPMRSWFEEQQQAGVLRADIGPVELARFASLVVNGVAMRLAGGDETDIDSVVHLLTDALAPRK